MALDGVKNFAKVTVSTGYDDTATSIVLSGGHGAKLPDPATANYNLVWWDATNYADPSDDPNVEIVRCTAKSTDTLTVTRAQESTTATTKNTGGATYKMILAVTSKTVTDIDTLKADLASPTFSGTVTLPTGLTGVIRADSGVVSVDTDVTDIVSAASTSVAGKVELATAAEIDTGTDTGRAISPDEFAGSNRGKRIITVKVFDDATALTTGNGKIIFMVPVELNGMNLVDVEAYVTTVSSSGAPNIMIRNVTDAQDMLSTAITIDANENSSLTSTTPPVINTTYDDVATGDLIAIDVDGAGTGAKGLGVILSFQTP